MNSVRNQLWGQIWSHVATQTECQISNKIHNLIWVNVYDDRSLIVLNHIKRQARLHFHGSIG